MTVLFQHYFLVGYKVELLAQYPDEPPDCNFFKRASTDGLTSAGIKILIGLLLSISSPR